MAKRKKPKFFDPQLEILDPPANCTVGKSFSISGTCNAGNDGVVVNVNCVDSHGHSYPGSCTIQDDNWSVPISVDCTGVLMTLEASAGGPAVPVTGVDVEESGIVTLPDNSSIGTEFTACGVCADLATDPCYVPVVYLTLHFNNADDVIKYGEVTTNATDCTWEAYFWDIPYPNRGGELTLVCGTRFRSLTKVVRGLSTVQLGNAIQHPIHGDAYRMPSDPTAKVKGNSGGNPNRWGFITRGGRSIHKHIPLKPNGAGTIDRSLQDFYPSSGVQRVKPYGLQLRTKQGGQLVRHSRGFHYFLS